MKGNYRINWKSGMRLTADVFNTADEYHASMFEPLCELVLKGGYGHLVQPRFRAETDNLEMSVIELVVTALTPSGQLVRLTFDHNERDMFSHIQMPPTEGSALVYLVCPSTEFVEIEDDGMPLREPRYSVVVRNEADGYVNPDAIPVARFEYRQCWMPDLSFIPPCVTLKANVDLWNHAHAYSKALKECIGILRQKMDSEADFVIPSLMGALVPLSIAMEKEMDELSPKRFVSMMQQVLGVITELAAISGVLSLPEPEACAAFVTAPYLPASIGPTVIEGTRLLNLLNISLGTLRRIEAPAPAPQPQPVQQTVPRFRSDVDTSGIRQRFERGRNRK